MQAETCVQEGLSLCRELRSKDRMALALALLAEIRRRQGDLTQAKTLYQEGVLLAREVGSYYYSLGRNLLGLARVAADEGQPEQAARLFAAAESWFNPCTELNPADHADYEQAVERVRAQLGEQAFAAAWAEGRTMTPEQALAAQGHVPLPSSAESSSSPPSPAGLTAREVEVLRLVAQGLTNEQVAQRLIISPRTVNTHLKSIYGKIQVTSRSAATRYAIEHQLL
jgi:DNA-binding CsgD family transcriptional regulator